MAALDRTDIAPDGAQAVAFAALVIGALAMAASPIFVRIADVGPFASAFWRVALALPALWAWERLEAAHDRRRGRHVDMRAGLGPILLAGAFFAGDLFCWHLAIMKTTVANATFFATTMPVFVVLGMWLVLRQRIERTTLAGLALALAGGGALIGESVQVAPSRVTGDIYGIVTAMFFGAYFLAVGAARKHAGSGRITFLATIVTAAILLVVALVAEPRILPASAEGWMVLAALALVSHAGGQGLMAFALGHLPTAFSSLVIFLEALAAAAFAWILLGEALSLLQIAGGAVILAGIFIARPRRVPVPVQPVA